ncbi:MAG: hypothetical protein ACTIJJ_00510 [Galactobacter sp.]|uniref:hypothetical protein n=1 Tax=Galactobacter sp. TaxID=2676125 RepID=UPI0025BC7ECF|nr:hypothetical protein [Galactobacter sp.]
MIFKRGGVLLAATSTVLLGLVLVGCDSGSGGKGKGGVDVSAQGQVGYACQLAKHVQSQGDLGEMKQLSGLTGVQLTAVTKLVGAGHPRIAVLGDRQDYSEVEGISASQRKLMDPALEIASGFTTLKIEALHSGLDSLVEECDGLGGAKPAMAPDVSEDGMVAYACALTDKIREEKSSAGEASTATSPREVDPRMVEAQSVAALLGGWTNYEMSGHEDLSTPARQLTGAVSGDYMNPGSLDGALNEVAGVCSADS